MLMEFKEFNEELITKIPYGNLVNLSVIDIDNLHDELTMLLENNPIGSDIVVDYVINNSLIKVYADLIKELYIEIYRTKEIDEKSPNS